MIDDWYRLVRFVGYWRIQAVSLELPLENVLDMLPLGVTLEPVRDGKPGHHPVRIYFNCVYAGLTWPSIVPAIAYQEVVVGIPYTYLTNKAYPSAYNGPFYYMPQVWTSTTPGGVWALGGRLWWGIPKGPGRFHNTCPPPGVPPWQGGPVDADIGRYSVALGEPFGNVLLGNRVQPVPQPILGLDWKAREPYIPVESEPGGKLTSVQRQIMDQPLLMQMPMGIGPWWVAANFKMIWGSAWFRSIAARLHINEPFVAGLPPGTYVLPRLEQSPTLGSYQLFCPFELSAPSSADAVRWTYPAEILLGPPNTAGVLSGVNTGP
jgi:hypothetical protein